MLGLYLTRYSNDATTEGVLFFDPQRYGYCVLYMEICPMGILAVSPVEIRVLIAIAIVIGYASARLQGAGS